MFARTIVGKIYLETSANKSFLHCCVSATMVLCLVVWGTAHLKTLQNCFMCIQKLLRKSGHELKKILQILRFVRSELSSKTNRQSKGEMGSSGSSQCSKRNHLSWEETNASRSCNGSCNPTHLSFQNKDWLWWSCYYAVRKYTETITNTRAQSTTKRSLLFWNSILRIVISMGSMIQFIWTRSGYSNRKTAETLDCNR